MKLSEKDYLVGLSAFNGIGPRRFIFLQEHFGSAKAIWRASAGRLVGSGLSRKLVQNFNQYRQRADLFSLKIWLEKNLIKTITVDDKNYPKLLKEIPNPPFLIFVKTRINFEDVWNNSQMMAVIGTRRMTLYGRRVTQRLVVQLVKKGLVIVSGLARGVDRIAHQSALAAGGKTIAVLGHGLDRIYPPEHQQLARKITEHGALISERPPFSTISRGNFPARNRIVAGLCQGVLVTEGASRSGTKITASCAADFGREVFAVPGPIDSQMSQGPADLIKLGAKLVYKAEDILEELPLA